MFEYSYDDWFELLELYDISECLILPKQSQTLNINSHFSKITQILLSEIALSSFAVKCDGYNFWFLVEHTWFFPNILYKEYVVKKDNIALN